MKVKNCIDLLKKLQSDEISNILGKKGFIFDVMNYDDKQIKDILSSTLPILMCIKLRLYAYVEEEVVKEILEILNETKSDNYEYVFDYLMETYGVETQLLMKTIKIIATASEKHQAKVVSEIASNRVINQYLDEDHFLKAISITASSKEEFQAIATKDIVLNYTLMTNYNPDEIIEAMEFGSQQKNSSNAGYLASVLINLGISKEKAFKLMIDIIQLENEEQAKCVDHIKNEIELLEKFDSDEIIEVFEIIVQAKGEFQAGQARDMICSKEMHDCLKSKDLLMAMKIVGSTEKEYQSSGAREICNRYDIKKIGIDNTLKSMSLVGAAKEKHQVLWMKELITKLGDIEEKTLFQALDLISRTFDEDAAISILNNLALANNINDSTGKIVRIQHSHFYNQKELIRALKMLSPEEDINEKTFVMIM